MMFKQPISEEIFFRKYALHNEKSVEEVLQGVAEEIASVENDKEYWRDKFYSVMASGELIPAGRILANARPGSKMKNYNNCFTIDIEDSMESIYNSLKEDALIGKVGGGVGFNISKLRPKGASISKGGESSGVMSFLEIFDTSAKSIHTGGNRRCLPLWYEVLTSEGSKKISDLIIGDMILFDGKEFSVNDIYLNGKQELVKIETASGWHVSTPNHKWLVHDLKYNQPVWVEARNLALEAVPRFAFYSF